MIKLMKYYACSHGGWHEIVATLIDKKYIMITQLQDLPTNVVGFRASGKVTKEEYDTVLIPAVNKLADATGKINYLFVLDTDISNLSAGAWYDDLLVGIKHLLQWRKMAIVSNQSGVNKFTDIAGHLMPGEVKSFTISQLDAAKAWVAS